MSLDNALSEYHQAEANLRQAAKEELGATLAGIFEQPGIRDVAWGQKYSEYNDEGLYPGIMGPVVNEFSDEDGNIDLDDYWSKLYESAPTGPAAVLKQTLERIPIEILCSIIGDDDQIVVAYQENGEIRFFTEWAGY